MKPLTALLIAMALLGGGACAEVLGDFPEWLSGTLAIMGGENEAHPVYESNHVLAPQQVYFLDFSARTLHGVDVPRDALLTREATRGGGPILLRAVPDWLPDTIPFFSREAQAVLPGQYWRAYKYDASRDGFHSRDDTGLSFTESLFWLHDAFALLGYTWDAPDATTHTDSGTKYCLRYAVSDAGELCVELARVTPVDETTLDETVYYRFPAAFPWNEWRCAIADDGKIAFNLPDSGHILISDGGTLTQLPDDQRTRCSLCWLDDDTLLYLNTASEPEDEEDRFLYPLTAYRCGAGVSEPWRCEIDDASRADAQLRDWAAEQTGEFLFGGTPLPTPEPGDLLRLPEFVGDCAVSPDGRYLAAYALSYEWEVDTCLLLVDLRTGATSELTTRIGTDNAGNAIRIESPYRLVWCPRNEWQ